MVRCISRVALPNIILDKTVVPELVQHKSNPKMISSEIETLLYDEELRKEHIRGLSQVKAKLSDKYSAQEVANVILENI